MNNMNAEQVLAEMERWNDEDSGNWDETPRQRGLAMIAHMREWLASQDSRTSPPHDPSNLTKYPRNWR